jgi:hypothetical protein
MDNIKDIIKENNSRKKAPAYKWQDLALSIIKDLSIPDNKRSSVFKICKEYKDHPGVVIRALTDTKELCKTGQKWKYFFKVINPDKK